jgi:hypothetical protein
MMLHAAATGGPARLGAKRRPGVRGASPGLVEPPR